jgi:anti-sigma factor RsiW
VSCRELAALATAYFDAVLDPATTRELSEHLAICQDCVAYAAQLQALIAAAPETRPAQAPDGERLRAAFRTWRAGIVAPGCGPSSSTS